MSIVIALHAGSYVLLAADTRMTFYPTGKDKFFEDTHEKIARTSMGLIAGVGYGHLLDSVAKRLREEDPGDTDGIIEIIKTERAAISPLRIAHPMVKRSVELETGWAFTYINGSPGRYPELGTSRVRCASSHPAQDYVIGLQKVGSACMFVSTQVPAEAAKVLQDELNTRIQILNELDGLPESIAHNTALCASVIEAVSDLDDSVSNRYQVGVHVSHADAPWLIGISDLSVDGLVNFTLKGPQASTSES